MAIKVKRIYDDKAEDDGVRVLVDRVWPRGISKENANLDEWLKNIGPTKKLREWFNHDADKFEDFKKKYIKELENNDEQNEELKTLEGMVKDARKDVIILFGAKDEKHNQAVVLQSYLKDQGYK
ncbi:DUF488 domain-containing protein [Staphylococcus sp. HMSC061G12]|uniref:DUF488 domain-containing protein n=1 Tax=Staphylococcus sp. HMSC061G12 TaxID=1739441 RepID=UPI0008A91F21|nr:DUF488 family protein [Staphylococcus sp. HMSC061G12]OHR55835.1 hypothetical protein HMPREF2937_09460 [Staphylococcus sp. HMSC061G12]